MQGFASQLTHYSASNLVAGAYHSHKQKSWQAAGIITLQSMCMLVQLT